jgi:hypothetical protein
MDEHKRMLAAAWRDLAGWSVGMVGITSVATQGCMVVMRGHEMKVGGFWLPDPDAPANWGVWMEWAASDGDTTCPVELSLDEDGWSCSRGATGWHYGETPAAAVLGAFVLNVSRDGLPPSVIAWWEAEQAGGEDG